MRKGYGSELQGVACERRPALAPTRSSVEGQATTPSAQAGASAPLTRAGVGNPDALSPLRRQVVPGCSADTVYTALFARVRTQVRSAATGFSLPVYKNCD